MHFVRIVETLNEPLLTLMKKYLLWICTAAALLAAGASCSDDPEVDSVGRVGIQQESLTADGAGEDLTLNVTSNAYWRINFTDPETGESVRWVTASETSGMGNTAVTLKVARNRSTSARSTYVNVITESESSAVSVLLSQRAALPARSAAATGTISRSPRRSPSTPPSRWTMPLSKGLSATSTTA